MNAGLKTALVVVPFLLVFLGIRACAAGAAGRWQSRMDDFDPGARVAIDRDDLIVVAVDTAAGAARGEAVRAFKDALVESYGDLLGKGSEQRTVVLYFSSLDRLQAYADGPDPRQSGRSSNLHGFTLPHQSAIFIPPDPSLSTLRHETVHLLMGESFVDVRYSPWLSEGLAQLFEVYDAEAVPPTPPGMDQETRGHIARHLARGPIDVDRLLVMQDYDEFVGGESLRNYLEALVLTAFLFEKRPRQALREYIEFERAYKKGRPAAFERIFKHRAEAFQTELFGYLLDVRRSAGGR